MLGRYLVSSLVGSFEKDDNMDEQQRQTEIIFSRLENVDKIQAKMSTHLEVMNLQLENHLKDHPPPILIKRHLDQSDADSNLVRVGIWGTVFKVIGVVITAGVLAVLGWMFSEMSRGF